VAARSVVVALVRSCHPVPAAAVTAMATVLALAAGDARGTVALVLAAVLAGQLSIGWSNDLIDAERDRAAGRRDKPVAAGTIGRRGPAVAIVAAVVAVVPLSLALGPAAGAVHLVAVAAGWAYDLGGKSTALSPVPYAIAFGALPSVATLAGAAPMLPPWWVTVTGALLGVGAHFGNVLPDIDDDRLAGVRGAPQRMGRVGASLVAAVAVAGAAGVLLACAGAPTAPVVLLAALVAVLAAFVAASGVTGRGVPLAFGATMLAAALCVAILVLQGALAR